MKKIVVLFLYVFVLNAYSQSPWVNQYGDGFSQVSFSTIPNYSKLIVNTLDQEYMERRGTDNTLQLYNEFGFGKNWGGLIAVPFKMQKLHELTDDTLNSLNETPLSQSGSLNGIGNISLAIRKGFNIKNMVAAAQIKADLKTYVYDDKTGMATGYQANSFTGSYSIGKGFNERTYFFLYTGFTYRTDDFSDMAIIGGEFGYKFFDQLWVIPFFDFNMSLKNGDIELPEKQVVNGFYINDQEYLAAGFKFIEELSDKIGVTVGLNSAFGGNNVAYSPVGNLGFYYKW